MAEHIDNNQIAREVDAMSRRVREFRNQEWTSDFAARLIQLQADIDKFLAWHFSGRAKLEAEADASHVDA